MTNTGSSRRTRRGENERKRMSARGVRRQGIIEGRRRAFQMN
jgi:hypothetical protein